MEIELKYRIPTEQAAEEIWQNAMFEDIEEEGSREELDLLAKYYDTEGLDLAENRIAYRIRSEGEHYIATVKWQGKSEDGLHCREELAVPVSDDEPDIGIFSESDIGEELDEIVQGRQLRSILETHIHRRRFRVDTETAILEFAVDEGQVITEKGAVDIRELEIELFTGETEELMRVGEKIQKQYELDAEDTSKYAKGISIIREAGR